MNPSDNYLKKHYLHAAALSERCGINAEELIELIDAHLVPESSYVVTESGNFFSKAFGDLDGHGVTPGHYFHADMVAWVNLAVSLKAEFGIEAAAVEIEKRFKRNYSEALRKLDRSVFRLEDSFDKGGHAISNGLEQRSAHAWNYFLSGVLGICVARPSDEESIARKDVIQEALTVLSDNGQKHTYERAVKDRVLALMSMYEQACMPFAPIEYPLSSRKRLVNDLRGHFSQEELG
jgi:hypothetical protein